MSAAINGLPLLEILRNTGEPTLFSCIGSYTSVYVKACQPSYSTNLKIWWAVLGTPISIVHSLKMEVVVLEVQGPQNGSHIAVDVIFQCTHEKASPGNASEKVQHLPFIVVLRARGYLCVG